MNTTLSLSTGSLYNWPVGAALKLAGELGFNGAEIVIGPETLLVGPTGIRASSSRAAVPIRSIHPPIVPIPGWIRLQDTTTRLLRWATDLAVEVVTLHAPNLATLDCDRGHRYTEAVDTLARDLAGIGTRLAIENSARFSSAQARACLDQPADLLEFARAHNVWITMDTAHAGTMGWDLNNACTQLAPVLANVHISDLRALPGRFGFHWTDSVWRHHLVPGTGILPLDAFMASLEEIGYQGPLTLELSPLAISAWSPSRASRHLEASLRFVQRFRAGVNPSPS